MRYLIKVLLISIPICIGSVSSDEFNITQRSAFASPATTTQHAKLTLQDGSAYNGEVKDGIPNGKGTQTYSDRRKYIGEFVNGQRDGQGTFTWPNGEQHIGTFKNGEANGYGTHVWKSGENCTGIFTNGILNGPGTYSWPDGRKYEGNFNNGGFHGIGVLTTKEGKVQNVIYKDNTYQGEWQIINTGQMQLGRAEWIGKSVLFINAYGSTLYSIPGDFSSSIRSDKLSGKHYTIKSMILKKSPYSSDAYYLQLQAESDSESIWYLDEEYTSSFTKSYNSYSVRPFLFQHEIDSPPGYIQVAQTEILPYKSNWIGQKIKFKTNTPNGFQAIIQDSTPVNAEKIVDKPLKVVALYKQALTSYKPKYFWKFIDESTGQTFWFFDDHYTDSASMKYISPLDDTRPFYLESEIQDRDQKINEFKSWIGKSIWADLNKSYEFQRLKISHLEQLTIVDVQVDQQVKEVTYTLQRENGNSVTWKRSISKYLKDDDTPGGMLSRVAMLENPYEQYDWSDETWSLIKQQRVRIGWGKEKCIMSWGRPKDINRTIGSWGVHEQWVYGLSSYLYFEDGILSSIQN